MASHMEPPQDGAPAAILGSPWDGVWIQTTPALSSCQFKLLYDKNNKTYKRDLNLGYNYFSDITLYERCKLSIEITHRVRSSKFYIHTLPGLWKDGNYAYEDLSITVSDGGNNPYEYFYLCPWLLQGHSRWLKINEDHLDLRLDLASSDRGIDIDWRYPFTKWLGNGPGKSIENSIEKSSLGVFKATLGTVKEYDWPEGFTVWLKTMYTDEKRISGEVNVGISLSDYPKLVIKKYGRQIAEIWTKDEGSWDIGVVWEVEKSRQGTVRHIYRPPLDDEGDKHDLYISPSWVTLYNYPHAFFVLGTNRGIAADISKDMAIWTNSIDESLVGEGSSKDGTVFGESAS